MVKRQRGQFRPTTRINYWSDVTIRQVVAPDREFLVTKVLGQQLSMVLGRTID